MIYGKKAVVYIYTNDINLLHECRRDLSRTRNTAIRVVFQLILIHNYGITGSVLMAWPACTHSIPTATRPVSNVDRSCWLRVKGVTLILIRVTDP